MRSRCPNALPVKSRRDGVDAPITVLVPGMRGRVRRAARVRARGGAVPDLEATGRLGREPSDDEVREASAIAVPNAMSFTDTPTEAVYMAVGVVGSLPLLLPSTACPHRDVVRADP